MNDHPLSDLSFFRFPDLTPEGVRNILILLLVLALTVLVTVVVQRRVSAWAKQRRKRQAFQRFSGEHHMPGPMRELLERLVESAGVADEFSLVHDARAYEEAVAEQVKKAEPEEIVLFGRLRRILHLNVMNPELKLVSTRQLLQELPVRLLVSAGEEKLDLYCNLFKVTEEFLLFDLPHPEEVLALLRERPAAQLIFWREREGESVFPISLEPVEEEGFTFLRAGHAFADPSYAQREAFRLTTDISFQFRFLAHPERVGRGKQQMAQIPTVTGEGKLVDLSYGGASLVVAMPLAVGGLAQLKFDLQSQPMRLMLEVLDTAPHGPGEYLARGRFRGLTGEQSDRLQKTLTREQIRRLRESKLVHIRP